MDTTVITAKGAIFDALDAADLTGAVLQYADDPAGKRERVYLGDVEEAEEELRGMGGGTARTSESYVVHVHVEVIGKKDARRNDERAAALVNAVRAALASQAPFKAVIPGLVHVLVTSSEWASSVTTDGPRTTVDLSVSVKARIR